MVASMAGIIAVTRFMLNARAAGLRSLACSGSSRLTMLGWGLCPPASRICWASGVSGARGAWATAAEYVLGSPKACCIAS